MRNLILIRHSNSKLDPNTPPHMWGLTDEGKARCIPLADQISIHQPEIIVTSVEPKAQQTGEIIATILGLPLVTGENLHEHEREHAKITTREVFQKRVESLFANPESLIFGLETAQTASGRFSTAVKDVMDEHPYRKVAIVSHGTVMSLYYGEITGENPFHFWAQLGLPAFYKVSWPERAVLSTLMNF